MTRTFRAGLLAWAALGVAATAQQPITLGALPGADAAANPADRLSQPVPVKFSSNIGFLDSDPALGASYPRVIRLDHDAAGPGRLLATFARRGPLPIYRSADGGESWTLVGEVGDLRGQPALIELPRRMGSFPAGTILAAGTGASEPGSVRRAIRLSASTDGGKSWTPVSTIAEGGVGRYDPVNRAGLSDQSPVWEPFLHIDAQGRLVASISDEGFKREGYSQLLEHKVSTDGGRSWGPAVRDVAIGDGLTRPGMAVVARAGDGTFFMSYEIVGKPGVALEPRSNLAHFKTSRDGVNWGDAGEYGTFIQDRWRQYPNGTPFIAWSPWGGPRGTLLVTGRSVLRYTIGRVGNGMMINRDGGRGLWTLIETPIVYNPEQDGYSQTMLPLGDGREILQMVAVNNRIAYAKFALPEALPDYPFPWGGTKAK